MADSARTPVPWSEAKVRALTEHAGDIISLIDREGRLLYNSSAAERISGFSLAELANLNTFELIHPDDREATSAAFAQILARPGAVVTVQYRYKTKDGGWTWMEAVATNHLDNPEVGGVVAVSRDISDRKRVEAHRLETEARFRSFLDACSEGFVRLDLQGIVVEANQQLATMLGCDDLTQLVGHHHEEFLFPEDVARMREHQRGRHEGRPERYTFRFRRRDGGERLLEISSTPIYDPDGRVLGAFGLATDVTEARALEERILQAQKLEGLSVLAGGIAHDFNNLLVGILGAIDLARDELPAEHSARASLKLAVEAAERAAGLCRQLRASAGRADPRVETIHLDGLINDLAQLLEVSAGKHAQVSSSVAADLPPIIGDPSQLRQVVLNLVTNASEAVGARSGKITVAVDGADLDRDDLDRLQLGPERAPGRWIRVRVSDDGCGIPPEILGRIFDPFFSTKQVGRGLGLAATLGIVRRHGGAIQATSSPGAGTTFTVLLPPAPGAAAASPPAPAKVEWRGRGRVLVVDDEEIVRGAACRMLKRIGFEVEEAEDGEAAVAAVKRRVEGFAVIVLDLTMPKLDGLSALSIIHQLAPATPVVLSSGVLEPEVRERATAAGAAGFVEKPYGTARLTEVLRGVLPG